MLFLLEITVTTDSISNGETNNEKNEKRYNGQYKTSSFSYHREFVFNAVQFISHSLKWNHFYMIIYLFQISQHNHFLNVLISLQMSRSFVNFAVHHIDINKQLLFIPRYANWSHVVINNHSFATTNYRNFLQGVSFLLKRNKNYFNLYARSAKDWFFSRQSELILRILF